jgi:2-phospho-L-lactate guanylyltransferase
VTAPPAAARAVFALIPMKPFHEAKSRLRSQVPQAARQALALAMFERVLAAALGCKQLSGVAVLTYGPEVALCARHAGAHVLRDAQLETATLGALVDAALPELAALGADATIVLMADLPFLESEDIADVVAAMARADLVLAPDARGTSTNALALRLPAQLPTAFGDARSFALHLQRAHDLGLVALQVNNQHLAHDVDVSDDLPQDAAWAATSGIFSKLRH